MWPATIKLIESGELNLNGFVTHRFPLKDYKQALELVESRRDGVLKAIIEL